MAGLVARHGGTGGTTWDGQAKRPSLGTSQSRGIGGTGRDAPPIGASHHPTPRAGSSEIQKASLSGDPSYSGSSLPAGDLGRLGVPVPTGESPAAQQADDIGDYEERAAIREFDGGLPRAVAERLAWADVLSARRRFIGNQEIKGAA